jgi:hypothetical protein
MTTAVPMRIINGDATSPQAKGPKVDGALGQRGVPVTVYDFDA